ncbi:nitrate reductase cytochrome c-type subunit [Caenispirillum bisanense]|uniref:Periplasmic nitrate reductase, electron transfer subunit n=1 Tax=Caenispirillum bisanense TaxID=414052 RepID=A0A286H1P6_9PROT|nr:nitrate reductase cytochrome c-type subunit [Caenispirillum bisanense]SOE01661.1 periplasmic nitrate reductase subunit NapB [Caenispirillum bisanense]
MRHHTKLLAAALVALGLGAGLPAVAADVTSLRGAVAVDELDAKPEIWGVEEGKAFGRAYRQQPPLIPHRVDKYEVDLKTNQCLSCHDWPFNTEFGAPKVSETHYVDRQGNRLDNVARTRWFCTQCHVPQMDAPELVDNTFEPAR